MLKYKVLRADRATATVAVGALVYFGRDLYGCASDDSRTQGIEYMPVSENASGLPFFTIPAQDVERVR